MAETVFLTIKACCARYSITRTRAYNLLTTGKLNAVRLAGRTLIQTESADAFFRTLPPWTPACGIGALV